MADHRDDELAREIQTHLELEAEEQVAGGMSSLDAAHAARRAFGNVTRTREDVRAVWTIRWLDDFLHDVRHALRALAKNRAFTTVTLLTLALGIGANTAIFSLMDQVLLRSLPVHRPGDLVLLDGPGPYQGRTSGSQVLSVPMFRGLLPAVQPVLSGMFARFSTPVAIDVGDVAERGVAELVSGEYFSTLGVGATIGRTLGPGDDRTPSGHPVVVLSHGYWQRRFGGATRVIDTSVRINGYRMTVVGVAPPGFVGTDTGEPADVFVPLMMKAEMTPTWNELDSWRSRFVHVMGRLRPDVSPQQAAAALNVVYRQLLPEDLATVRVAVPQKFRAEFVEKTLLVHPGAQGRSSLRAQFSTPLAVLMGMVGVVLLIACANVANLLLARAAAQRREVAIRQALGAGRLRLVRQRLAESGVLAAGGAALGLVVAWGTTSLLIDTLPFETAARALSPVPDVRVVLFCIAVACVTACVFGLAPALHATRPAFTTALKEDTGSVAGGSGRARLRKGLVVAQVALSILLVAGAGLFGRSLYNLRNVDPGFRTDNLLQFRLSVALSGYTRERALVLLATLDEQLRALPGVAGAALAVVPTLSGAGGFQTVRVQGYHAAENENMSPAINAVGPGYFATMGMPLVEGREFRPSDGDSAPKVAVINETMASYFWAGRDPIGGRFGTQGSGRVDEFEVVGVVRDAKFRGIRDETPRLFYLPYMQRETIDAITLYIRHQPGAAGLPSSVREVVQRLDPQLPIAGMKTMESQVDESLFLDRLVALLALLFGALATVLASVGLYGVTAYTVSRRTREIGIRMALGAARASVLWLVLREVVVLAFSGIVLGLPFALGSSRLLESQLFGLSPTDPATLGGAAIILTMVAVLAGYVPAMRAARVNPILALRYE